MRSQYHEPRYIERDAIKASYHAFHKSQTIITKIAGSIYSKFILCAAIFYAQTILFVFSAFFFESNLLIPIFLIASFLLFLLSILLGLSPILFSFLVTPMGYGLFVLWPRFYGTSLPLMALIFLPILSFPLGLLTHIYVLKLVMKSCNNVRPSKHIGSTIMMLAVSLALVLHQIIPRVLPGLDSYMYELTATFFLILPSYIATVQLCRAYLVKKYCPYLVTLADARYTNVDEIKKRGLWG